MKKSPLREKLREVDALEAWQKIMGPNIMYRTEKLYMKEGVLHIKVDSSIIKHDIFMMRNHILRNINEHLKEDVVKEIVLD
jgi:predicted nucleic acid-binding Zn ribbon protein